MHAATLIRRALFALILVNLVVFVYISNTSFHWIDNLDPRTHKEDLEKEITIILYDFEHFENDVVNTAKSFLKFFPKISILIVSDELPYPPLQWDSPQVKLVVLNIQPDQPSKAGRPEEFIKTKYVLFVADGFLLDKPQGLRQMIQLLDENYGYLHVIATGALGATHEKPLCQNLTFDVRRWSLKYSSNKKVSKNGVKLCSSISGEVAVLLRSEDLPKLSAAFSLPFLEAFFIQSSLRKWKVALMINNQSPFVKNKQSFTSQHNNWKHETNREHQRKELFRRFGIKKVETRNGIVEWHGCDKNTPRCFGTIVDDVPAFIHNGRWTPPCCLRNVRQTARHVLEVFDNHKILYWLEGGSLLGAARHGDIIPWDYDVDIGMYKKDIEKLPQLQQANIGGKVSDPQGFVWEKSREGDFFRVQYSNINHMHIDIFPFYEKNGIMTKDTWFETHRQDTEFPVHYLQPLEKMKFIGMDALVPNNYKEFLEYKFGKGVIENPRYPNARNVER